LVCLSGIAVMFGAFDAGSAPRGLATIPEIIWEAFLGIYLTFKGFKMSSAVRGESHDTGVDPEPAVAAPCRLGRASAGRAPRGARCGSVAPRQAAVSRCGSFQAGRGKWQV